VRVRSAISAINSATSGVCASACTSAVCGVKPRPAASGATPENTRYWSMGSAHSMTDSAGSSMYSALLAHTPTPTVPAQSVTSGSSACRWSRMSRAAAA
jgi:hypothetical protein